MYMYNNRMFITRGSPNLKYLVAISENMKVSEGVRLYTEKRKNGYYLQRLVAKVE